MNNIAKTIVALAAVCSVASPLQAAEGILIVEKTVTGSNTRSSQIQIERDRMRAEMTAPRAKFRSSCLTDLSRCCESSACPASRTRK